MKEREKINNQFKPNLEQGNTKEVKFIHPQIQQTLLETQTTPKNPELNLESFDLNDEILGDLYGNTEMNTYDDNVDPMKLFQEQMNQRDSEDNDYKKMQRDAINFEEQQKMDNKIIDSMNDNREIEKQKAELDFQASLSQKINTKMNDMDIENIKSQVDRRIEQNLDEVITFE